jgi:hypothetical protein
MRATLTGLSAVLLLLGLTAVAQALSWFEHSSPPVNAFSTNFCYPCWAGGGAGGGIGPYGNWPPPCGPFQGFRPPAPNMGNSFTQPFARSPRDYFMVDP